MELRIFLAVVYLIYIFFKKKKQKPVISSVAEAVRHLKNGVLATRKTVLFYEMMILKMTIWQCLR